jgi:hypothetical protein
VGPACFFSSPVGQGSCWCLWTHGKGRGPTSLERTGGNVSGISSPQSAGVSNSHVQGLQPPGSPSALPKPFADSSDDLAVVARSVFSMLLPAVLLWVRAAKLSPVVR